MGRIFDASAGDQCAMTDPGVGSIFDIGNGETFACSFWIYPTDLSAGKYRHAIVKGTNAVANANYVIRLVGGASKYVSFYYYDSVDANIWDGNNSLTENQWNHVTFSFTFGTAASIKCYVDGAAPGGSWVYRTGATVPIQQNANLEIGGITGTASINRTEGTIGDILIYKNPGVDAQFLSLIRYRPFQFLNGCIWSAHMGMGSPEPDLSGNGNNGILSGTVIGDHSPTGPPFGFDAATVLASRSFVPVIYHHRQRNF